MHTPQELAWLDQNDAEIAQYIREYGWAVEVVGFGPCDCCTALGPPDEEEDEYDEGGPAFAYSIGLFGMGHPELVVIGLSGPMMGSIINYVASRVVDGANLVAGELLELDVVAPGLRVVVEELPRPGEIVHTANRFYKRPPEASVEAFVLTWCDEAGRFPWEAGHDHEPGYRPRPGTWSA